MNFILNILIFIFGVWIATQGVDNVTNWWLIVLGCFICRAQIKFSYTRK